MIHSAFRGLVTASGRIKSAAMAYTTAALYIVLHTRPSPCLMVSQLRTTFAYHALCCRLSKVVVIAVTSRGTQSLFINVRLSAGLYEMLSNCGRIWIRTRTNAHLYFAVFVLPITPFSQVWRGSTIRVAWPQAFASYQQFATCLV